MTLLCIFIPAVSPQVHCSHSVGVVYNFIKRSSIPKVGSGIDIQANIFGPNYEADVLQNSRLEKDHLIIVPFLTSRDVDIRSDFQSEPFPDPARRYVIALGGETKCIFFHIACHLPSSSIPLSRCVPVFW